MSAKAWRLTGPGGVDAFQLVEREVPPARPGWVSLAIESFGLNRSELYSRKGLSSPDFSFPRVLGLECAGRVLDPSDSDLERGTRVIAMMGGMGRGFDGSYATHAVVPRTQVFRAPSELSPEVLGAVPETYNTAQLVCVDNLHLKSGECVLVRGGTSALGMAAIEIAVDIGCVVVATSRSAAKADLLRTRSRATHVLVDGGDLPQRVLDAVGPIAAVVECVGSKQTIETSCATMTDGGRLGLVGLLAESWEDESKPVISPNVVTAPFTRSDLIASPADDERVGSLLRAVVEGRYRANIHRTFGFDELPEAHRVMEANEAVGKLVVLA